ncbi:MAG: NADH-quinone oxidoreductase subunit NuoK [Verrucomicrobia bacterium]|nr:NADH-quinone oxidoreductase subunit NuoK [Pseudomonadota bacterium]NBS05843.1 NADH-quinone oxidoreductase subunit NuoK [Verrucomicrobiota bacterium]NBS78264.1 NADH-quinone oxidoreductase subunit NuoK [bacterium]NBS49036.1 NADH-quinone oxidoreductase subunit NuoK [Verrucomicrobiota bacterium]NBT23071.1 NADH-quinone oxidoreductase subunit NuoK [bacterium]
MNFGEVTLGHYLALSLLLFLIGLAGVILRRSLLVVMMSLELLLNAANLALVAVGKFHGLPDPQVAVFFVITVAAAEVALGLAILVAIFRIKRTTAVDQMASLRF